MELPVTPAPENGLASLFCSVSALRTSRMVLDCGILEEGQEMLHCWVLQLQFMETVLRVFP